MAKDATTQSEDRTMIVDYKDERGRSHRVEMPDGAEEMSPELGIPVGPPDIVDGLELPEPFATRLHNELFARGLFDEKSLRKNMNGLVGALQAALRVDVQMIHAAYVAYEKEGMK